MARSVIDYYDKLAPAYDRLRFGNSYGRFLDRQERAILDERLPANLGRILDLGCGTGRLMDLATDGCDASAASLQIARGKHPTKRFCNADVAALPFADASFDAIFCFHVFMHLPMSEIEAACEECARVLRPGGSFIVDVASRFRRRLRVPRPADWHGGTALDSSRLAALAHRSGLRRKAIEGVMLLPAHRLPEGLRGPLCSIDRRLAALAPDLASYIVGVFVKEPRR